MSSFCIKVDKRLVLTVEDTGIKFDKEISVADDTIAFFRQFPLSLVF